MPHSKSRGGCVTCKARKVRCDEAKPACLRCSRAKLRCEGYLISLVPRKELSSLPRYIPSQNLRPADSLTFYRQLSRFVDLDQIDFGAYDFCRRHTVHELSSRPRFWTSSVLACAEQEPAVLHALLALAAAHRARTEQVRDPGAVHGAHNFGPMNGHYYKAVQFLRTAMLGQPPLQFQSVLIICLVLIGCDLLQGRYGEAFLHLRNGRRILQAARGESPQQLGSRSELVLPAQSTDTLNQLAYEFASLDLQSVNFGSWKPHFELVDAPASNGALHIPETFNDIDDASRYLLILQNKLTHLGVERATPGTVDFQLRAWDRKAATDQGRLLSELSQWGQAFNNSSLRPIKTASPPSAASSARRLYISCRLTHAHLTFTARMVFQPDNDLVYDDLMPHFATTIAMCEELAPTLPKISLDTAIIPSLFILNCHCRHPVIRRRCLQVLSHAGIEGHWDARLIKVASQVRMEAEEEEAGYTYDPNDPPSEDPQLVSKIIPQHARYTETLAFFTSDDYRWLEIQLRRPKRSSHAPSDTQGEMEVRRKVVAWPPSE